MVYLHYKKPTSPTVVEEQEFNSLSSFIKPRMDLEPIADPDDDEEHHHHGEGVVLGVAL